jgi:hypothetical protein
MREARAARAAPRVPPTPRRERVRTKHNAPSPFWSAAALPPLFQSRPRHKTIEREAPPRTLRALKPFSVSSVLNLLIPHTLLHQKFPFSFLFV